MTSRFRSPEDVASAFHVSRESLERLKVFVAMLKKWQRQINLIGPCSDDEIWMRHIADSLQIARLLPGDAKHIVDLGSGAGFPGLVLAIAVPVNVTLVESNGKKAAFLRESARMAKADATVLQMRIEQLDASLAPQIVTARALAPLPKLLDLANPLLQRGAVALFHKGEHVDDELTEAAKSWRFSAIKHPSVVEPKSVVLEIKDVSRATS